MSLVEYVNKIGAFYDAIESVNNKVKRLNTALVPDQISLGIIANYGEVPVLDANALEGKKEVSLEIHYLQPESTRFKIVKHKLTGSEYKRYNYGHRMYERYTGQDFLHEHRHTYRYEIGDAEHPDEPIILRIEISSDKGFMEFDKVKGHNYRHGKVLSTDVESDFDEFIIHIVNNGSDPCNGEWTGSGERSYHLYRNQHECSFSDKRIPNLSSSDTIIRPEGGTMGIWRANITGPYSLETKMNTLSEALSEFFKVKGYETTDIDIGAIHNGNVTYANVQRIEASSRLEDLTKQLEAENVLGLTSGEVSFLQHYLGEFESFMLKYSDLRGKFGEDIEFDPLQKLVRELPTYKKGLFEDLSSYTVGLKAAIKEEDHGKSLRKLKAICIELMDMNKKVSPDYQEPWESQKEEEAILSILKQGGQLALPE